MPTPNRPSQTKYTTQNILNNSYDGDFDALAFESLGFDGQALQKLPAGALATKITVSGAVTYIGVAAPGTAQGTAKWQCRKIDETTGTVITWADGDANFDNTATDLTAHTYS